MKVKEALLFLRIVFFKNGYWKLFSLIIATLVYFSIRSEISHARVINVALEVEHDVSAMGAVIESIEPRTVQVTVRGSYLEVNQLMESTVRCVLRPKQKKGALIDIVTVKIDPNNLLGVRGLRVVKIEPNTTVVKFDVPMTIKLAVAPPVIVGKARGRVELEYPLKQVSVHGSRRLLSPLDVQTVMIQPEAIDVEGRSQTFSTRVKLIPPGDIINAVIEPAEMAVNVVILNEKAIVKIERIPVIVSQPFSAAAHWKVEPDWVDVEVTGRAEVVKAIAVGEIVATVDGNLPLASMCETNMVPVRLHVKQGLTLDDIRALPATIKLIPLTSPASTAL